MTKLEKEIKHAQTEFNNSLKLYEAEKLDSEGEAMHFFNEGFLEGLKHAQNNLGE